MKVEDMREVLCQRLWTEYDVLKQSQIRCCKMKEFEPFKQIYKQILQKPEIKENAKQAAVEYRLAYMPKKSAIRKSEKNGKTPSTTNGLPKTK